MKTNCFWIVIALASTSVWVSDSEQLSLCEDRPLETKPLFDEFEGDTLNPSIWLIARSQWGGEKINGGVVPDNIHLESGKLLIKGHGDHYTGPVKGVRRTAGKVSRIAHGRRTGACLVTRECYASGRYEVRMKIPRNLGVCTALWTFHYLEVDSQHDEYIADSGKGDIYISNHEIDIELPGRPGAKAVDIGYDWALFNTWIGERDRDMTFDPTKLPREVNDGKFYTWRFDWHTGDPGKAIEPRVDFYLDGELMHSITTTVPVDAGQFWMGLWFPDKWAGNPDFEVETLEIDWVRITPFHELGDRYQYSQPGPNRFLMGSENWPKRLQPKERKDSNKSLE